MDSESAAASANSLLISESTKNGGDPLSPLQPPAAAVAEDDFETASESEDSEEETTMQVEKGETPIMGLSESPEPDGESRVEGEAVSIEKNEEAEISGGGSNEEAPNFDGEGEKDEVFGGGSNLEAANSAVEAVGESKAEGNGGDFADDEITVDNIPSDSKLVEVEPGVVENEKKEDEKDESFDGSVEPVEEGKEAQQQEEAQPETEQSGDNATAVSIEEHAVEAEPNVAVDIVGSDGSLEEVAEDSKLAEVELNAKGAEKVQDVLESKAAVEEEGADLVVDDKNADVVVVDSMAVETEFNAGNVEKVDDAMESKATEEEGDNVVEDVKQTDIVDMDSKAVEEETISAEAEVNGASDANQDLDEVANSKVEVEETDAVAADEIAVHDIVVANQRLDEAAELKSVEKVIAAAEADKDMETEEENVVLNSDQVLRDSEAKPSDGDGDLNLPQVAENGHALSDDSESNKTEAGLVENSDVVESETNREIFVENMFPGSVTVQKVEPEADSPHVDDGEEEEEESSHLDEAEEEEEDGNVSDQQPRVAILDSSEAAKQIIKEMEEGSSRASFESSRSYQHPMDGQIISDSDEEVDTDEEGDGKELFDAASLAALLKAASGASSDGSITVTSQDGNRVFSMDRPAGLGSSAPALRPAPSRSTRPTLFSPSELVVTGEPENEMDEEERKLHEKVEEIRVKFLRLVMRLGHTPDDTVAAQVLYRLSLAEGLRRGRQMSRAFSIETAKKKAIQLETEGDDDLKFSCNILVLGKTGVGKSATINSIFGEEKTRTNAFQAATSSVREISGVVDGVKIRVIDTPGLKPSVMDQATNRRILSSIKKYTKKCTPDIVLYVDRLDTQTRDFNDLPLLRSITSALGSSIWFNAIVALTHAASAPPEGSNGSPLSYEVFIAQRSHVVQHSIRQAAGDMRLMNPVALVENHPSCRRNREGQRVLPNGLSWRPQMLLLCYSSKILSEANSLLKLQDPSQGKLFGFRFRSPPLPYLLSTLLQSRPHPKLPSDQGGENADSDIDLDDFSDADEEEENEYDQLPPFKPLKKSQLVKLTDEQKRAYFDEYDYRVKLLQKKQFKEEVRRLKEMKKRGKIGKDDSPYGEMGEDFDPDGAPAAVPVPLPDMVLPPSFDCDVPTYRYRFLEPTSQLLTRPVLDTHGWDHDCGYDGVSIEESLAIASRFPAAVAVQITKDKKDFSIHLDSSISAKHGENGSSLAGFDIQSVGKQLAYILRGETKFKNFKKNKTTAGASVTFLGETLATGLKVEDQLMIGKRLGLVVSTGAVRAQGDVAYGANLEARLREKDYPIGQALSTLGLSLMKWRGDLALGANLQSQVNVGRNSKVAVRVGLNNKLSGQITVRTSTSEQLQIALVGIIPVALTVFRSIWSGEDTSH